MIWSDLLILLAAALAMAGAAVLLLPVVLAFSGARWDDDGGFDISAQAAVWAGLLGVRLRRRGGPAWELVPTLAGRALGPRMRLGGDEREPRPAADPGRARPEDGREREPRLGAAGLRERLHSLGPLARPLLREARVEFQEFLTFTPNTEKNPELPLQEYEVVLEAMKRCPNVDRPVRRRRPVHKEDKLFGLHMVRKMPMAALAITWCRLMDRNPAWLKAYGDYKLGLH